MFIQEDGSKNKNKTTMQGSDIMKMSSYEKECLYNMEEKIKDGNIYAMEEWATFYAFNYPQLVDKEKAVKIKEYYEKAIEIGSFRAMLNLGALYYQGNLVARNYKKAIELYEMASNSDDSEIASIAITNLGYCYYYGRDIPVDYEKAFSCYLKGAIKYNNVNCYFKLGDMYKKGLYVEKDEHFAFDFYKLAHENCYIDNEMYPDILIRMGESYLDGVGIEQDPIIALKYLSEAEGYMYEKVYNRKDTLAVSVLERLEKTIAKAKDTIANK